MLTCCSIADAGPKTFGEDESIFKLVYTFSHVQKAFIGFADTGKRVEECVSNVVDNTRRRFRTWWVSQVLMHMDVLSRIRTHI